MQLLISLLALWSMQVVHPVLPAVKHKKVVIAHRGDHTSFPENTLAAYQQAINLGADYIETDLRTTKDSQLVIMHNASTERMTGVKGNIHELTYDEVRALSIGKKYKIPSFKEVLALCHDKVNIYLDFKDADVRTTYRMIQKAGMEKQVVVYANTAEQLEQWTAIAPAMPVITSVPEDVKDVPSLKAFLDRYMIAGVDGSIGQYSPEMLQLFKSRHVAVWLDVQEQGEGPDSWTAALEEGIDGMQTDHPAALISYLKQLPAPVDKITADFYHHPERILVTAHRAAHTKYPENSLPAINRAIAAGIDIVELDIRETKDGKLVLMHDKNVDRTTNGKGLVSEMTWAALSGLRLKHEGQVTKEHIPTFEAALKMAKGKIMIDIDFKAGTNTAQQETYRLVKQYQMEKQVLFFMYDYREAAGCKALNPALPVMPRVHNAAEVQAVIKLGGFPVVHVDDSFYADSLMTTLHQANMRVWSNALGDYDDMEEVKPGSGFTALLKKKQVNVIQTNYPEALLAFLKKAGYHR